ncbi:autophagy-related protein 2 homolog A [Hemiscyllium ocellatum]|uniref:autophagy-related protein 2 homolog A n=1 Tax=Hemiscyllium ocellatum TaxID=170820 RepID=UPI00296664B4|nr:autophagy-related protein 2 homolog A [Hemiscyllium ocellatum]
MLVSVVKMSWFFPWSSSIKKRACRYLLQHYLGHLLEERLTLEQLSLDLYNGSGSLSRVQLDVWSLNEFLDSLGAPLEVTDGFISSISVTIPWSALITENCTVEVTGLQVTCRPKYHFVPGTESPSWSSCMTTSMQLAKECLKEQAEEPEEPTQPLEGLEMFAQTIETVLRRIKVTFLDTIVRVEHTPDGSRTGTALEVHIKRLEYCDEAVKDSGSVSKRDPIPIDIHQPPAFVHKVLQFSGVSLHYEEIPEQSGEPQTSPPGLQQQADPPAASHSFPEASSRTAEGRAPSPLVQIGSCTGCLELTVKFKQNDALPGPKLAIDGKMGSLHLFLNPQQVSNLADLLSTLNLTDYVCVLDVDLLELVITTWKGDSGGKLAQPLFELRCSNNVVHVHTCADSCATLVNLVQYVVNSGDLHPPPKQDSPTEIAGQRLQLPEPATTLPPRLPAETAEINQGDLTDALIDTERNRRDSDGAAGMPLLRQDSPVSVYLFPGENNQERPPSQGPPCLDRMDVYPCEGSEAGSDSTDNDDFCILDAPGMGIPPKDGEPVVSKLTDDSITIRDGYFARPIGSTDLLKAPARFPVPDTRLMLREISVVWHLYGGKDFSPLRPSSGHGHSPRIRPVAVSARGSPSRSAFPNRPQNTWRTLGGSGRNHDVLMEIQLTKVSFQHETYPAPAAVPEKGPTEPELEEQPISRQVFIVQELEIRDRLATSQINKFLYLYTSEKMPRRAHSNMLTIKALHMRPESGLGGPECCLRVSLMPLRLNIDQDALFFLKDFFTSFATGINPVVPVETATEAKPEASQRVSGAPESESTGRDSEPGQCLPEMTASMETTFSEQSSSSTASSSSEQPIYFREFRFTSEVPIWLDYHGKHVTMDQGTFAGILIGLAQLNCSELKLKRLCCRHGLLGVDKVINYALTEWLNDIRKNQLPGILGGVGPMHSVVQLFHGLRDLFWLPIEQYRKDGRIIRGLQRGAASFGTSTASAALELSNRLVQAIQATAETVYDILSPTPPITKATVDKRYLRKYKRVQQPADLREGVAKAYDTVREGVIDTAQTICEVATRGHEQKGITGAVGGVLRQIPPTVVKPLIVATEATSNLLGGMRNQIKPDARKEDSLKWRTDEGQE